jgi:hypothetical protein
MFDNNSSQSLLRGSSLVNELGFNAIRKRQKVSQNKMLSAPTVYYALTESDVFKQFHRASPSAAEVTEDPLPTMPTSMYRALASPPSTGDKVFESITDKKKSFRSYSGIGKNVIPGAFRLMVAVSEKQVDVQKLPTAWHALIPCRMDIMRRIDGSGSAYVVLETTRFSVWSWPCFAQQTPNGIFLGFGGKDKLPCWVPVCEHTQWYSFRVKVVAPLQLLLQGKPPAVDLKLDGPHSMLVRAAQVGFHHLSPMYTDRLLRTEVLLKNPKLQKPDLLIERIMLLIAKTIPKISTKDPEAALLCRAQVFQSSIDRLVFRHG